MDVFKPFLQRLSQPILLSFCIAWIFWNWEIVVALCWYDAKNIEKMGYKNHVEYINTLKDTWRNYWWPLIIAGIYPFVILLLNNFHTLVKKWEENLFFKIVKDANVPTKLLLDAQYEIDEKEKSISKFIAEKEQLELNLEGFENSNKTLSESNTKLADENKELKGEKGELDKKVTTLEKSNTNFIKRSSVSFLTGEFSVQVLQMVDKKELLLAKGTLKFIQETNASLIKAYFDISGIRIESIVDNYSYNIISDDITLTLNVFKSENIDNSVNSENIISYLDNLFDSSIVLRNTNKDFEYYTIYADNDQTKITLLRQESYN